MKLAKIKGVWPNQNSFVLRVNVPVPKGTFTDENINTLEVVSNTKSFKTGNYTVTRYPNRSDGADVVEVQAVVSGGTPGQEYAFDIKKRDVPRRPNQVNGKLRQLIGEKNVWLVVKDVFGNQYKTPICSLQNESNQFTKMGQTCIQFKSHELLTPAVGAKNALDHLLGVMSIGTIYHNDNILLIDLLIHNGDAGETSQNIPNTTAYFHSIELWCPKQWKLTHKDLDPAISSAMVEDAHFSKYVLVKPLSNGKMHTVKRQGGFIRRLGLSLASDNLQSKTDMYLQNQNLAFCSKGEGLYSWWDTGRFSTNAIKIPWMPHAINTIEQKIGSNYTSMRTALETGMGGVDPWANPTMGYARPYGSPYGGMTGGEGITFVDGLLEVQANSVIGYNMWDIMFRMNVDRQPMNIWKKNGEPISLKDLVKESSIGKYLPEEFYILPKEDSQMLRYNESNQSHKTHVESNNLQPDYQDQLFGFSPHDVQHFIRFTRNCKVLIWLGNDLLAKECLKMVAECCRLSFIPYYNNQNGGLQGSNILNYKLGAQDKPNVGTAFGRGEGWEIDTINTAYAFMNDSWRTEAKEWLCEIIDMVKLTQGSCNGFFQGKISEKMLDGKYRVQQMIEHAICCNALYGTLRRVFQDVDEDRSKDVVNILTKAIDGLFNVASQSIDHSPNAFVATTTLDKSKIFCSASELPTSPPAYGGGEGFLSWNTLAIGQALNPNTKYFQKALGMAKNSNLWKPHMNSLLDYMKDKWATTAHAQMIETTAFLYALLES